MTITAPNLAWSAGRIPLGVRSQRNSPPLFDALTSTAHELQKLLRSGKLKSTDLVQEYVWRIEEYNDYLRAVSDYAPEAMSQAKELDSRRASGEFLGPLHGIPVLLKNTFATHPSLGMDTTGGAVALEGSKPSRNAVIVDKLIEAGAIILGKTTVSELSFHKGVGLPCGWSARDGQGQSPYVRGGFDTNDTVGGHSAPGGSSSGLSIAISAGFAPLGVGEDTESSLTAPAVRTSLYSLRPSTGIVDTAGLIPVSHSFDTPGPMAKDVTDLSDLLTVLVNPSKASVPEGGYTTATDGDWSSLKIGALDPKTWQYPDWLVKPEEGATEQMLRSTNDAYNRIESLAARFQRNVDLPEVSALMMGDQHSIYATIDADFKGDMDKYLSELDESNVRSLQELVDWNTAHASEALPSEYPSQEQLITSLNSNLSEAEYEALRTHYQDAAAKFDETLDAHGVDIIIAPGDCFFPQYAPAGGRPIAALPLGYLDYNGRPNGLQAMAAKGKEALLLAFLRAYETSFPPREPPKGYETPTDSSEGATERL